MKKILLWLFITAGLQLTVLQLFSQSVAINNDGSDPHSSSMLDIKSTTKGLLIPRMTTAERDLITDPAKGLLVFDDDENTFYFHNGGGWIALSTGSSTNFWSLNGANIFSNTTGNVGIGINNPADKLTVQSPINSYGITHTDGAIVVSTFVGGSTGGGWIGTQSNHGFHIYTNNGSAQVSFNTDYSTDFKGVKSLLRLYDGSSASGTLRADVRNMEISARKIPQPAVIQPGNLILQADEPASGPFGSYQLSGNVGIGTRSPAEKLSVYTPNNSYGISHISDGGLKLSTRVGVTSGAIGTYSNHNFRIICNSLSAISIVPSGNVGIGLDFPTQKFEVNGTIRSKEVIVESSGWPDYVFDKSYKLSSLDEVEKFIKQNKHLPNIPSAAEIEKYGQHLGEIQKRMLEKIEELTLYVIELKKEIEQLKKQ